MRLKTYWSTVSAVALLLTLPAAAFAEAGTEASAQEGQEVQPATNGWGIAVNDLTPDAVVRYGTLPNGMRYALRRNEASQGTASVRFTIDAGRLAEMADERGLAHFLEHMAFRGSKAIPDGELLKKLERLGLAFGADTNAETAPDYTRYKLDLPRTDDAMIDAALMIMRQTASELTLEEESTKQESGVILAEAPTRDSPLIRNAQEYFRKAAPDSKLGDSFMTDDQTDVRKADAATLRRFYERNYRG
jgi:zinc protease